MVLRRIVLLAAVFLGTTAARAQLTWTGATNGNFDLAGNWSGSFVNDGTASVTFTGAPANSPVLNVPVSLASLTYAAGTASFTIASSGGNALTLGSALNQNSGNLQTIAAPLVLGSGFSFNGAGAPTALALSGGVTASNGFTVTNGLALQISHSAWTVGGTVALQSGAGATTVLELLAGVTTGGFNVGSGTLLKFNSGNARTTVNGAIAGTGTIEVLSPVTLTGANSFSGGFTIQANALTVEGSIAGNVTVNGGASFLYFPTGNVTYGGAVSGGGFFNTGGTGTLTLTGQSTHNGGTAIGGGTLVIGVDNALPMNGNVSINSGATLSLAGNQTVARLDGLAGSAIAIGSGKTLKQSGSGVGSVAGTISGAGALALDGGTLNLSGNNTYTGGTTVNNGGALSLLNASGSATGTGNVTVGGGSILYVGAGGNVGSLSGNIANSGQVIFDRADASSYAGAISGGGNVTKRGAGTLTLAGNNTYAGFTQIDSGATLVLAAPGALPASTDVLFYGTAALLVNNNQTVRSLSSADPNATGSVAIGNGATLTVNLPQNMGAQFSGVISGGGSLVKDGPGRLALGGTNTFAGNLTVNSGELALGTGPDSLGGSVAGNVLLNNNAVLALDRPGAVTFSNAVSGTGNVTVRGTTNATFTGVNSYTGSTNIGDSARLAVGAPNTLPVNSDVFVNGTGVLAVNNAQTLRTLNGGSSTANVTIASGVTLTLNPAGNTGGYYAGGITGAGALLKAGAGSITLAGNNSYTGNTTITGGTLFLSGAGGLAATSSVIVNAVGGGTATFNVSGANTTIANLTLGGSGATANSFAQVSMSGGVLGVTGNVTYDATNNPLPGQINGGTLNLVGNVTFVVGNSTNSAAASDLLVQSEVAGTGALTKVGDGVLVLGNFANSLTGAIVVRDGVLVASSLGSRTNATVSLGNAANASTLRVQSSLFSSRAIDLAGTTGGGTIEIMGGAAATITGNVTASGLGAKTFTLNSNSSAPSTLGGAIADSANGATSVLKTGFGTWSLNGASTYTGNTTVAGGTLMLGQDGALGSNATVQIRAGNTTFNARLDLNDHSQTVNTVVFGNGNGGNATVNNLLTLGGEGTLTLTGNVVVNASGSSQGAFISAGQPFDGDVIGGTLLLSSSATTHTFDVGDITKAVDDLTILAGISGAADTRLIKTGAGSLVLAGSNTYAGGTTVTSGALYLAARSETDTPLGTGALTLQSGTTLAATSLSFNYVGFDSDITLANAVSLANNVTLGAADAGGDQQLHFVGAVTLADQATRIHLGVSEPVIFGAAGSSIVGSLNGAAAGTTLTFDNNGGRDRGKVFIANSVGANVGNIVADGAAIFFARPETLTSGTFNLATANGGYLGIGAVSATTYPTASQLFARIGDKAGFAGTIGFDTVLGQLSYAQEFSDVNLSAFGAGLRVGSASAAILTGNLTGPSTGEFQFGNGGGALVVESPLGGAGNVSVSSSTAFNHNALTLVLQGYNTFAGNLAVDNSLAILDATQALPTGSKFHLGANGYVGYTSAFTDAPTFASFVARLGSYTGSSVLGLDANTWQLGSEYGLTYARDFAAPNYQTIDLSALNSIYLGTATGVTLHGNIIAPQNGGTLRLLAPKGAYLGVASTLRQTAGSAPGVTSLVVGTSDTTLQRGQVELLGANTFSGGTTLLGGTLLLGTSSKASGASILSGPLGTGALTIGAGAAKPILASLQSGDTLLHNAIKLGTQLQVGLTDFGSGSGDTLTGSSFQSDSRLVLSGDIADLDGSNHGGLTIYGDAALNGSNSFTGGVTLVNGALTLGSNTALGNGGTFRISPTGLDSGTSYVALVVSGGARTLANPVELDLFNSPYLSISGDGALTLTGALQLNSSVAFQPGTLPLTLGGAISGAGQLAVQDGGTVVISGTGNSYGGGTYAEDGKIIFGSVGALPSGNNGGQLRAEYSGYIGVATPPGTASDLQNLFLNRFDKSGTAGTIGFDSPSGGGVSIFTGAVDLTGFNSGARLGSATSAILNGTITPDSSTYQFGGGGGLLEVNSPLVDSTFYGVRSLSVSSPWNAPLTLRLGATGNTLTGSVSVSGSALVFKAGALPANVSDFYVSDGYVGTEDAAFASNPAGFLGRFAASTGTAGDAFATASSGSGMILGFDSFNGSPYVVTGALDLSSLTEGVIIGTTTQATLASTASITLTSGGHVYRFAGYKGGALAVDLALADASPGSGRLVVIGDSDLDATMGAPSSYTVRSSVTLNGTNTYTGGTVLAAGMLNVGHDSALGTGVLTVDTASLGDVHAGLFATGGARTLANAVSLLSDLDLGGANNLTLTGAISGGGELYKVGSGRLTLSGNNSGFSGGLYIAAGDVTFGTANSVGTGPIALGTAAGPSVTFNASTTLNGLSGDDASDRINLGAGVALTLNQTFDIAFSGTIAGGTGSSLTLQNTSGSPTQIRLSGTNSYGPTTIAQNVTVLAGSNSALGTPAAVTLRGGRLVVESGVTLGNAITLASGTLAGTGTLQPPAAITVGAGGILAPGFNASGTLTFSAAALPNPSTDVLLTLSSGGVYQWRLLEAFTGGATNLISATGKVAITATANAPFTLQILEIDTLDLISLSAITNFDPYVTHSWTVLDAPAGITGSAAGLAVDFSGVTSFLGGGSFSLSLNNAATTLTLNFVPVPEPATYALLALGALVVFFTVRRRRA